MKPIIKIEPRALEIYKIFSYYYISHFAISLAVTLDFCSLAVSFCDIYIRLRHYKFIWMSLLLLLFSIHQERSSLLLSSIFGFTLASFGWQNQCFAKTTKRTPICGCWPNFQNSMKKKEKSKSNKNEFNIKPNATLHLQKVKQ